MGTLALSHSATADRAVEDQSTAETGAPVRVVVGPGAEVQGTAGPLLAAASGGADRVVPVARDLVDIGTLTGVTALAVDAATASGWSPPVGHPRRLDVERPRREAGGRATPRRRRALPGEPDRLTVRAKLGSRSGASPDLTLPATVLVRDARGLVTSLPLGRIGPDASDLSVDLPSGENGLDHPLTLLGVAARAPEAIVDVGGPEPTFTVEVESVEADGRPVGGLDALEERSRGGDLLRAGRAADLDAVPAVVTRAVASATDTDVGDSLAVTFAGRSVPIQIVDVVESLPTARTPDLGIPSTSRRCSPPPTPRRRTAAQRPGWSSRRSGGPIPPPPRPSPRRSARGCRPVPPWRPAPTRRRAGREPRQRRYAGRDVPRHGGGPRPRRGRFRGDDRGVGPHPPPGERRAPRARDAARRIRRVLALERVGVVVLTVAVGLALGVLAALAVVPVLVGGDGHPQVPRVLVSLPAVQVLGFGMLVAVVLSVVGVLVLRGTGRDIAAELRARGAVVTGRHLAAPRPSGGAAAASPHAGPLGELTLLRRSIAAERGTAILLAVLTVVTTAFLVAVPRVESTAHDRALGDAVTDAVPVERDLGLRLTTRAGRASRASSTPTPGPTPPFVPVDTAVRTAMGAEVTGLLSGSAVAARATPWPLSGRTGNRWTWTSPSSSRASTTRPWARSAGPPADRRAPPRRRAPGWTPRLRSTSHGSCPSR